MNERLDQGGRRVFEGAGLWDWTEELNECGEDFSPSP
jgi:hypothetical protein